MSGSYAIPSYDHKKLSASAAFLLHAAFFLIGGAVFSHSAEFGVEAGLGGMEVHLTAAPAFIETPAPVEKAPETVVLDKDPVESEPAALPRQETPEFRGDGSSAVPGRDSTTMHTVGGALIEARPNYLKNPAPRYPEEARRAGQQGLVLLSAHVDEKGFAGDVSVKTSSGYALLDESALATVRKWKFKPAKIGPMAVSSQVEIPVRFRLDGKVL